CALPIFGSLLSENLGSIAQLVPALQPVHQGAQQLGALFAQAGLAPDPAAGYQRYFKIFSAIKLLLVAVIGNEIWSTITLITSKRTFHYIIELTKTSRPVRKRTGDWGRPFIRELTAILLRTSPSGNSKRTSKDPIFS